MHMSNCVMNDDEYSDEDRNTALKLINKISDEFIYDMMKRVFL